MREQNYELPWLSRIGIDTYKKLLCEETTTDAVKAMLKDRSVSFTNLDLIWLQRVTASIDGDRLQHREALERMLESGHDLMQQSAEAELIVMNLPKEIAEQIRRQFLSPDRGPVDNDSS